MFFITLNLNAGEIKVEERIDMTQYMKDVLDKNKIVAVALSLLGQDYMPGGESRSEGFDCSGLTQYCYNSVGIKIPRTSYNQYKSAIKRGPVIPRKGDLVFFNMRGLGASHVGVYIGDGKFVHAPGIGRPVRISSMKKPYWQARYVGCGYFNR